MREACMADGKHRFEKGVLEVWQHLSFVWRIEHQMTPTESYRYNKLKQTINRFFDFVFDVCWFYSLL
jgi:hypothetical protein